MQLIGKLAKSLITNVQDMTVTLINYNNEAHSFNNDYEAYER